MIIKVKNGLINETAQPKRPVSARKNELNRIEVIQGFGPPIEGAFDESLGLNSNEGQTAGDNTSLALADSLIKTGNIPMPKRFVLDPQNPIYRTDLSIEQPGEEGRAVKVNKNDLNAKEKAAYDEGWKKNAFNEYASNKISIHRSLPKVADKDCGEVKYPVEKLPDTSVIIWYCFS